MILSRSKAGALVWTVLLCALPLPPGGALADDKDRTYLLEENDSLYFNSDKHYTQGLRDGEPDPRCDGSAQDERTGATKVSVAPRALDL